MNSRFRRSVSRCSAAMRSAMERSSSALWDWRVAISDLFSSSYFLTFAFMSSAFGSSLTMQNTNVIDWAVGLVAAWNGLHQ